MFFFFLTSPGQSQFTKRIDTPISHFQIAATASRPTIESKTNEDEKEVQTETLTIKARPMADGYVKAKTGDTTTDTVYNNWYKSVYQPTAVAEQQSAKSAKVVS